MSNNMDNKKTGPETFFAEANVEVTESNEEKNNRLLVLPHEIASNKIYVGTTGQRSGEETPTSLLEINCTIVPLDQKEGEKGPVLLVYKDAYLKTKIKLEKNETLSLFEDNIESDEPEEIITIDERKVYGFCPNGVTEDGHTHEVAIFKERIKEKEAIELWNGEHLKKQDREIARQARDKKY
jgi:hypothetical protein